MVQIAPHIELKLTGKVSGAELWSLFLCHSVVAWLDKTQKGKSKTKDAVIWHHHSETAAKQIKLPVVAEVFGSASWSFLRLLKNF